MTRTSIPALILIIAGAFSLAACGQSASPADAAPAPRTETASATTLAPANEASAEFTQQLQRYLDLRKRVEGSLPKLTETNDPRQIALRAATLADGIATARKDARQGDVFTTRVAAEFRRILAADAAARTPKAIADLMAEVPGTAAAINAQYPVDSPAGPLALPSFPPNLLAVLPELPETVEYRFLGSALVLRDASANLIVDYLSGGAPARAGKGGGR